MWTEMCNKSLGEDVLGLDVCVGEGCLETTPVTAGP
jgi:hypothetical protein